MILAIDVGNTNTVLGVFDGEELLADYRVSTDRQRTADEWGMLLLELLDHAKIDGAAISGVIISSVVPPIITELAKMSRRYFRCDPEVVGPGMKTGISIRYENPKEVGADRIVNAVAGYELYGGPLIIVDFGTATTFCAIGQTGDYLGGAIAPGIMISAEALYMRAARLPRVELTKPQSVIGKNTVSSMQAGILYGFVGQVDEIVRRIKQELGGDPKVIATGGLAEVISLESDHIDEVNQNLTLIGLRILWERNHS
ncbi:MAG: type III pantothenate kinase [Bacillota bacterium]|jgi:type III pantothenate kinase|nr:type III pantothenate kinase [Bacillota bacterium]HOB42585.1 type III pantothenate kinase [Bacillota bacterium]HOK71267.1 type III pantothenate kinase [Bacillota bacterium]HOL50660.1 type III pantothenate kinase [Bacillota bacterium]HOO30102.1 type III pantothenate kinase [Bacillota bacterium]